jgi:hypothetical protein
LKIFGGDFKANVGREDIFKPATGNESLHEISNDNGETVVNFATSKNLIGKSTMFPHHNVHNYSCTSDGKTDKRLHLSIADVWSFRGAVCDTIIWWLHMLKRDCH